MMCLAASELNNLSSIFWDEPSQSLSGYLSTYFEVRWRRKRSPCLMGVVCLDVQVAPYLIARDRALPPSSAKEFQSLEYQASLWENGNQHVGGTVGGSRSGYAFADSDGSDTQFWIPGCSFVEESTWASLDADARNVLYLPCVPTVTIELVNEAESMEDLQAKVVRCVAAGTRKAVVVDTQEDRLWIHNQGETPYFDSPLDKIEFDSWPGFMLDCVALRDAGLSVFQLSNSKTIQLHIGL